MAKKKSRSANVARKREKRNRDRKSRSKQLAAEKQRKQSYGKMNEERLHNCLIKSRDLINEPEFEEVHFDIDLMYEELFTLLRNHNDMETSGFDINVTPKIIGVETEELNPVHMPFTPSEIPEFNVLCEKFRTDVLRRLINPKFMRDLQSALTACEKRFKQNGDREMAEVAHVSHTLFEVVPQHVLIEHPLIIDIGLKTMQYMVDEPLSMKENETRVRDIVSGMLETETAEYQEGELSIIISDAIVQEPPFSEVPTQPDTDGTLLTEEKKQSAFEQNTLPSPDTLPAKALYKNFDGMAIKNVLKEWQNDSLENESETQLDLFYEDMELYITITENRIQLHAHSAAKLDVAMEQLEEYCQSGIMYLAKTIEEGGNLDATE